MANGYRKYIIDDTKKALAKIREIGAENIRGVSGKRQAYSPITHDMKPYYTVFYNKRAEFEISEAVMQWFIDKGIFVLDE